MQIEICTKSNQILLSKSRANESLKSQNEFVTIYHNSIVINAINSIIELEYVHSKCTLNISSMRIDIEMKNSIFNVNVN